MKSNDTKRINDIKGEYAIHPTCPECGHAFVCCSDCGLEDCDCE